MSVKSCEKIENSKVVLTIDVGAEEFEKAVNKAYNKMRGKMNVPGFRPGKAPRKIIEGMYGAEVFYEEAVNIVLPDAYEAAVKEQELDVVGYPEVELENVGKEGVTFKCTMAVYPEVKLGQYKGLEAPRAEVKVMAADVNARLKEMADRNSRLVSVERAVKKGDTADIDFEGFDNGVPFEGGKGENFDLEIGSGSFVPGFEDQLIGMKAGEEKDIDITFPENYAENLAGKAVVFHIVCNEVSAPEYPELDDEFAKDVSEFDTFEDYKADVRANLQKRMDDSAETAFKDEVIRKACENMTGEIPEVMFEEKVDEFLRNYAAQFGMNDRDMTRAELLKLFGMNEDSLKFSIRPAAEAQVKTELLLEAVAKAEGLEPTEEELQAYYEKTAKDVGATVDDVKRYFGEDFLKNELKKEQAMNLIVGSAVAKSADEMDPEEAAKEMKEEFADEVAGEAVAEAVEQAEEKAE